MEFPNLSERLRQALSEDGAFNDITTRQLPEFAQKKVKAIVLAKADGIFCGGVLIKPVFSILDPKVQVKLLKKDGAKVKKGQKVAEIKATASAILGGERTFLNLACRLSGISTLTNQFVETIKKTKARILDTRKTTPLWRDLEKYAVRMGGGENHRMTLAEAILVKDNNFKYLNDRNVAPADVYEASRLRDQKGKRFKFLEVEAKTYADVWEGIKARADIVMLDNMEVDALKGSIKFIKAARTALGSDKPLIEISGGVNLKNAKTFADLGVDRISVGAVTHSAPALDLSLEII
jgi:nicotinate-nucleotide pyrophosphorylase (carboxylating)